MMLLRSFFLLTLHCACGWAMRLSDSIYITTPPPTVDEQDASQSGIHSDLVAPSPSSLSQYYHEQEYPQHSYYEHRQQQATQLSPFLYTGPLILTEDHGEIRTSHHPRETKNIAKSSPAQERNSYKLYRPKPEDNPQFVDMYPPSEIQDEPNYYAVKPKKNKKYSAIDDKQKKYLKAKESDELKAKIVDNDYDYAIDQHQDSEQEEDNDDDVEEEEEEGFKPLPASHKRLASRTVNNSGEAAISSRLTNESESSRRERDTKKSAEEEEQEEEETDEPQENISNKSVKPEETEKSAKEAEVERYEQSAPTSRLDFQIHGHKGPKTYKFGFDTGGKGKNRQFKVEEKDEHGNVLGQYGYYDDKGKLRIVKYSSMANDGFKIL